MTKIKIIYYFVVKILKLYYNCIMENQMKGLPLNQPVAGDLGHDFINRRRVSVSQPGSAPNQRSMECGRHQRYRPVERSVVAT